MPLDRGTNLKACWRKLQSRAALNKENKCVPLWTVCAGLANHKDVWAAEISLWFVLRQWCGHMTAMWPPPQGTGTLQLIPVILGPFSQRGWIKACTSSQSPQLPQGVTGLKANGFSPCEGAASWTLTGDWLRWHRSPHGFVFLDGWLLGFTTLLIPKSPKKPQVSHLARAGS